ncbi:MULTISPECIES: thioesterase family protein [unclassified Streptomyces]|uniref:acyl-CoA thioesterase n=1 Tax=Streptomycetaceae TaxID=2062 RepID=UPI002E77D3DE|nr:MULTISPECIES: thioesterase family protein [unclassified Streptomyces]MED7951304.1 hotdog domain-containing protein [Streptomyces sp. BE303]MEE1824822.1 hotdog domain-containing protein [Streptomyces sp. BE20]
MSAPHTHAAHANAHVLACPTRWSDVDENGHINNARLVSYVQEGIYDLFCHHAVAVRDSLFPSGFLIARHEIDYLEQLHHQPEPLLVRLSVERLGRSSAHVVVNVCRDPRTYMRARTVVVARDEASGRSRTLSPSERSFLSAFQPVDPTAEGPIADGSTGEGPAQPPRVAVKSPRGPVAAPVPAHHRPRRRLPGLGALTRSVPVGSYRHRGR